MAKKLSKLIGTEEDKVTCSFFWKMGACRHGDKCTRLHYKPPLAETLLIPHMYDNPPIAFAIAEGNDVPREQMKEAQKHFEEFYEDIFKEFSAHGEIDELIVCDNFGDHLIGNVYAKFNNEEDAQNCLKNLSGKYYNGKLIIPEFSIVSDFHEAKCKQYKDGGCSRGGYCNFIHEKYISRSLKKDLYKEMFEDHPEYKKRRRDQEEKERKKKKKKHRSSKSRSRSKSKSKDKKHKKKHHRSKSSSSNSSKSDKDRIDMNMTSAERRAMIESWNQQEDDDQDDKKGGSSRGGDDEEDRKERENQQQAAFMMQQQQQNQLSYDTFYQDHKN